MKRILYGLNLLAIIGLLAMFNSCNDSDEPEVDPCENGPSITFSSINKSIEGQDDGSFSVDVTGGTSPYTYSIDGSTFQASNYFGSLEAKVYDVTAKDANGCTATESVEIAEIPIVSFATQVDPIIQGSCQVSGCHGENSSIPSLGDYAEISAKADRVKARTGEGTMPPTGALSATDVQLIADWVDQGAPDN